MIGYMMVIYIAGLQNIPQDLNEAAQIDGAGPLQTLRYITIPMVMPSVTICTFLTLNELIKTIITGAINKAASSAIKKDRLPFIAFFLRFNNLIGIIFVYLGFGAGLSVFMMCGFVKSIPLEIEEARL